MMTEDEALTNSIELAAQNKDVVIECDDQKHLRRVFNRTRELLKLADLPDLQWDAATYANLNQIRVGVDVSPYSPKFGCIRFILKLDPKLTPDYRDPQEILRERENA